MTDGNELPAGESLTAETGADAQHEGRSDYFMDIDRMVNEGLGGGNVTPHNGLIDESTTDTMEEEGR
ncbi:hypothetical protein SAMN04487969_10875 [Paenibacillus algorifonticola]|uniref:Uncharacterized protein n=1 Tax=Paenibacillus algorifonticola TaxID=684063 RepID=A0A1I2DZU8_9BACL|nr:hypothetical protein [Paenibacillus algorifonticola]SFE85843.1 hypothetical protein SAMN04487969_10875 [Paenibacillus algorifonticola]